MKSEIISELVASLSVKDILHLLGSKVSARLKGNSQFKWTPTSVFDATSIPELTFRTYLEMRDLQGYLHSLATESLIQRSADIGSGFGRLLPLLSDFSNEVFAFEREKDLAEIARRLNPNVKVIEISDLSLIEAESSYFDFVLVFTVLQHLTDKKVSSVAGEITRIMKKGGHLLLCEQTDASDLFGDLGSESVLLQHGRAVDEYERIFNHFQLLRASPRVSEPTYRRQVVGSYMLFRKL